MENTGYALTGKTTTQFQDYGTAMANRYKNTANLIWMIADDYFGNEDTQIAAMLASMRAAGDTNPQRAVGRATALQRRPHDSADGGSGRSTNLDYRSHYDGVDCTEDSAGFREWRWPAIWITAP